MNTTTHDLSQILSFTTELALETGKLITHLRSKELTIDYKSPRDLVTSSDIAAEKLIIDAIKLQFPTHSILSEEAHPSDQTQAELRGPLWIIDPIDGTTNYSRGLHHSAVSIAFADEGEVLVGVVHIPELTETYTAQKSGGAFCNGDRISVSSTSKLEESLIGIGQPFNRAEQPQFTKRIDLILENCLDLRRNGAGAIDICWVACGRLDGFWETLQPWDIAAANRIAREAGATIGHIGDINSIMPEELNSKDILVATPTLYSKLRNLLRPV